MTRPPKVVVVGGGLAGLVTAYRLACDPNGRFAGDVLVLEGDERVGGKLRTELVDGFLIEAGADAFVPATGDVETLASALGIGTELVGPRQAAVRAYLRSGGRLKRLLAEGSSPVARPGSLLRSPLVSTWAKARMLAEPLVRRRPPGEDESVEAFLSRRLGRWAYEEVYEPLLAGVHGAEPGELSAAATLPGLVADEAAGRSILRLGRRSGTNGGGSTRAPLLSFRDGMSALPEALLGALGESRVHTGVQVVGVRPQGTGWEVETSTGDIENADAVVLAVPAAESAPLLASSPEVAGSLASFPTGVTAVVNLAYPSVAVGRPLDAHGYINHRREGRPVSACTCSSAKFDGRAPTEQVLLRGFVRGAHVPPAGPGRDGELVRLVRDELADSMAINEEPLWSRVQCWTVPVYAVGHPQRVAAVRGRLETAQGLLLAGASYDGVGVEAVVRSADRAARDVAAFIATGART